MTARFRYRAADASGRVLEGDMESLSRRAAIEDLRRQRLFPVDVEEVGSASTLAAGTESRTAARRSETLALGQALALWTRTVATMLGAGVTLERALSYAAARSGNARLDAAVAEVRRDVRGGSSLATALRRRPKVFGTLYVAMISAGEESGALDQVMARLADHLDEMAELRSRLRSTLLYPALMGIVASMGVTVILLFVVPRFAAMLSDVGGTLYVAMISAGEESGALDQVMARLADHLDEMAELRSRLGTAAEKRCRSHSLAAHRALGRFQRCDR